MSDIAPLPFDVRFALRYRGTDMTSTDIADLARNFSRLSFYLLIKGLDTKPECQLTTMQEAAEFGFDSSRFPVGFIADKAKVLDAKTKGTKIAAFYRRGMSNVINAFSASAHELDQTIKQDRCAVVAYSMIVGLPEFAQHMRDDGGRLLVINANKERAEDKNDGLQIVRDGDRFSVSRLGVDFIRPDGAVIVDDMAGTGSTFESITDLWTADGSPTPEFRTVF